MDAPSYEIPFHTPRRSEAEPQAIPHVIYQSWGSRKVLKGMKETHDFNREYNPEFDFYWYTDEDCLQFLKDEFEPEVAEAFDALVPGAFKSDLWRYCILYKRGGVYFDAKFQIIAPFASLLKRESEIFVKDSGYGNWNNWVYNAVMASPPGNPNFRKCIDDILEAYRGKLLRRGALDVTGPEMLGRVLIAAETKEWVDALPFSHKVMNIQETIDGAMVYYNTFPILRPYRGYRYEQRLTQRGIHYNILYENKHIWKGSETELCLKVFVIHYTKLTERKEYIQKHLPERGILEYEFVETHNQEDLTEEEKNRFALSPPKTSLFCKHLETIQTISDKNEYALILEDDVILCDNFLEKLKEYWKQIPPDWDMIFIGDGANLHIEAERIRPDQYFYEPKMHQAFFGIAGASRCSDSYFIRNPCAKRITHYVKTQWRKTSLPYDWWLNKAVYELGLKVYWVEPTIVTQGSACGLFQITSN
jgi:GR25 family glycosyltransferase involved in LPS biosynthesis